MHNPNLLNIAMLHPILPHLCPPQPVPLPTTIPFHAETPPIYSKSQLYTPPHPIHTTPTQPTSHSSDPQPYSTYNLLIPAPTSTSYPLTFPPQCNELFTNKCSLLFTSPILPQHSLLNTPSLHTPSYHCTAIPHIDTYPFLTLTHHPYSYTPLQPQTHEIFIHTLFITFLLLMLSQTLSS